MFARITMYGATNFCAVTCLVFAASLLLLFQSTTSNVAPVYRANGGDLEAAESGPGPSLPTVTVRGFLNFRTTVDGTVIVFTPASEDASEAPSAAPSPETTKPVESKLTEIQDLAYNEIKTELPFPENALIRTKIQPTAAIHSLASSKAAKSEAAFAVANSDLASQQQQQYPTGLVTVLGGTNVDNDATTIHETKVIGTYIDGKYAQILQSTSRIIIGNSGTSAPVAIVSSSSVAQQPLASSATFVLSSRRDDGINQLVTSSSVHPRSGETQKDKRESSNTVIQSSFRLPEISPQRPSVATQTLDSVRGTTSSAGVLKFRPTSTTTHFFEDENTVSAKTGGNNNNRRSSTNRLRYVLPPRQSQTVRLNRFKVKLTLRPDASENSSAEEEHFVIDEEDDPLSVDPHRVRYEKTTITSQVTLHVGRRKSVRTLTITTTVPRIIGASELLSNGLIEPTEVGAANHLLSATSRVPTEPETPPLVISRTYSTTERAWRTSVVPVYDGKNTTVHTVTESFFIRKIITAYKTMPPGDLSFLVDETEVDPLSTLDSINQQTALLHGAIPLPPSPQQHLLQTPLPQVPHLQTSGLDSTHLQQISADGTIPLQIANPLLSLGAALSQNPLAAVYLGLHQLNRQVTQYSTITKTSTYVTTDTVYSTKVVRFYDGRRTRFRTLSESVGTTEKTVTTLSTTVEPYINTQALQQQQQLQQLIGTQLPPPIPPPKLFSTITSSYTTVTTATSLSTKIYTLIYNAFSTKFRTVTSTSLYPTTLTTYSTTEVPIAASAFLG